jgi:phage shock protein A
MKAAHFVPFSHSNLRSKIMRKVILSVCIAASLIAGLFVVAGRGTHEIGQFAIATAESAVDGVTESLPEEIHDRKVDNELKQVRLDLIDRQVQMNLSSQKIAELTADVSRLENSIERRQRLLAEAYPILKTAIDGGQVDVLWANETFQLPKFQTEIDDLLSMQDREQHQLEIKGDGLQRLQRSIQQGEQALAEMKRGLEETEQQVAVLRTRREQAEIESSTLDLVASATANQDTVAASLGRSVDRLKDNVAQTEARNLARRGMAPITERSNTNGVARSFNRLESLKAIHEAQSEEKPSVTTTAAKAPAPAGERTKSTRVIDSAKVVIEIQSREK